MLNRPRVLLVSHRLGGIDGVSIEADKWTTALAALGWSVTRASGHFGAHSPSGVVAGDVAAGDVAAGDVLTGNVVVSGLWAAERGGRPPPVDLSLIDSLCATTDLLVLDNAGTLPTAPAATRAFRAAALRNHLPTIVRHHDPGWQVGLADLGSKADLPVHDPAFLHVVINEFTRRQFSDRWPILFERGALALEYNRIGAHLLRGGDRATTRAVLQVPDGGLLLAHPARIAAPHKNIAVAVDLALEIQARTRVPVHYWLTDPGPGPDHVEAALRRAPGLRRGTVARQRDLYAACDLVLLPSTWEGFGLPVIEAAAAGRPVIAGPYPVLDELRSLGLRVFDPVEIAAVAALLTDPTAARPLLEHNRAIVERELSTRDLPGRLSALIERARGLMSAGS